MYYLDISKNIKMVRYKRYGTRRPEEMCTEDLPDGRMSRLVPHSHALYPHLLLPVAIAQCCAFRAW